MDPRSDTLVVSTRGRGLHDVTDGLRDFVRGLGGARTGVVHVWIRHTSARKRGRAKASAPRPRKRGAPSTPHSEKSGGRPWS